MAWFGKA
jgi:hypothetical protein